MRTIKLEICLESSTKKMFEMAAALRGYRNITDYVLKTLEDDASRVIDQNSDMVLQNDVFDAFWEACMKTETPDEKLQAALTCSEKSSF